jgi:predicted lipoprotein with Yx(FWY)xxD motif
MPPVCTRSRGRRPRARPPDPAGPLVVDGWPRTLLKGFRRVGVHAGNETTGEGSEMFDLQGQRKKRRDGQRGWRGRHVPRGQRGRRGRSTGVTVGAAAAGLALVASLAAMAFAASTPTVGSLSSSKLKETVVVNSQGRTLYWLSAETTHHLLCRTNACFKFWPPLTVGSSHAKLVAGPGVHGSLGILHRNGIFQVTLRGMPLYRYYEDHARGQVNGQGIKSFGGTWHAVTASADPPKGSSTWSSSSGTPPASTPGGSTPSSGGGSYESSGGGSSGSSSGSGGSGSGTSTTSSPSKTTTTAPKEEKTTPKEEKAPPKEESQAEKEAREKREKEAREKREKEEKEYKEKYPEEKW